MASNNQSQSTLIGGFGVLLQPQTLLITFDLHRWKRKVKGSSILDQTVQRVEGHLLNLLGGVYRVQLSLQDLPDLHTHQGVQAQLNKLFISIHRSHVFHACQEQIKNKKKKTKMVTSEQIKNYKKWNEIFYGNKYHKLVTAELFQTL